MASDAGVGGAVCGEAADVEVVLGGLLAVDCQYVRQQVRAATDHPRVAQFAECLVHRWHALRLLEFTAKTRNMSQQIDKEHVVLITSPNLLTTLYFFIILMHLHVFWSIMPFFYVNLRR